MGPWILLHREYIYIYTYTHTYIYIYIHTHTHTHIHIHMHTGVWFILDFGQKGGGCRLHYVAESRGPNSLEGKLNLCISGVQIQVFRFTFERLRTPAPRSTNWGVGKQGFCPENLNL